MKTCEGYEDLISAFIDGMLSNRERVALMEHMANCPVCQNYFNEQIAIHDALMDDMETMQVPGGFTRAVMEQVRAVPQKKTMIKLYPWRWKQWAVLAACCALAVAGVWRLVPDRTEDTTDMQIVSRAMPEGTEQTEDTADLNGADLPDDKDGGEPVPAPAAGPEQKSSLSLPTPAQREAAVPEAADVMPMDDEPEAAAPIAYAGILTTDSPLAAAWVEEHFDSGWIAGERYELNAAEYQDLKEILSVNDAALSETPGPADCDKFLLIADTPA